MIRSLSRRTLCRTGRTRRGNRLAGRLFVTIIPQPNAVPKPLRKVRRNIQRIILVFLFIFKLINTAPALVQEVIKHRPARAELGVFACMLGFKGSLVTLIVTDLREDDVCDQFLAFTKANFKTSTKIN